MVKAAVAADFLLPPLLSVISGSASLSPLSSSSLSSPTRSVSNRFEIRSFAYLIKAARSRSHKRTSYEHLTFQQHVAAWW